MAHKVFKSTPANSGRVGSIFALTFTAALALSACGGGGESVTAEVASASPQSLATAEGGGATPFFHLAPAMLEAPVMMASGEAATGEDAPHAEDVAEDLKETNTSQLLPTAILGRVAESRVLGALRNPSAVRMVGAVAPMVVYTPAQTRAAYRLPVATRFVPYDRAAQAALGAGQTIYIVDAHHSPNALADLATYSRTFGLPLCVTVPISPATSLPLAKPSLTAGCTVSVVYSTATGERTTTAPAYDQAWATEIVLDLQTAHAMAPLARLVLIEAPSAAVSSLANAVTLANSMGPGIVSMSFGAPEGSWGPAYEASFKGTGMRYVAATGDSGMAVNWPSSSASVLATGGTTLTYSATTRAEVTWAKTGGGISNYVAMPSYQAGLPEKSAFRRVADVAFNSDPYTGQYIAFTPPGGTTGWLSGGGTSIAAPAWAGMLAVGEAMRLNAGLAPLISVHDALYLSILPTPMTYSQTFLDIKTGANGTCLTCGSATGYDNPTGLGAPNATALLTSLSTIAK